MWCAGGVSKKKRKYLFFGPRRAGERTRDRTAITRDVRKNIRRRLFFFFFYDDNDLYYRMYSLVENAPGFFFRSFWVFFVRFISFTIPSSSSSSSAVFLLLLLSSLSFLSVFRLTGKNDTSIFISIHGSTLYFYLSFRQTAKGIRPRNGPGREVFFHRRYARGGYNRRTARAFKSTVVTPG